jgi:prepilin-type N-terminal cleavage/methylation domain-containing protein
MKISQNMFKNKLRSMQGFTLLELVIVIAIIGILAVIVLPSFIDSLGKARDAKKMSELRGMQTFLTTQGINTGLRYPKDEADFRTWASTTKSRLPQGFNLGTAQVYYYAGINCNDNVPAVIVGTVFNTTCESYQLWTELEQDNPALKLDSDLTAIACNTTLTGPCLNINQTFPTSTTYTEGTHFNGMGKYRTGNTEGCTNSSIATSSADCVFDLVP